MKGFSGGVQREGREESVQEMNGFGRVELSQKWKGLRVEEM